MARRPGPERTCVGCRAKAAKATLLRVVAIGHTVVPDATGALPGRGASVHRDLRCVALADKRRAFPRALRLPGPLDATPVRQHVAGLQQAGQQQAGQQQAGQQHASPRHPSDGSRPP